LRSSERANLNHLRTETDPVAKRFRSFRISGDG
jgi:hypothetical protein